MLSKPPLQLEPDPKPTADQIYTVRLEVSQQLKDQKSVKEKLTIGSRIAAISNFQSQQCYTILWHHCVVMHFLYGPIKIMSDALAALAECYLLHTTLESVTSPSLVLSILRDSLRLPNAFMNPFSTTVRTVKISFHFFHTNTQYEIKHW